MKANAMAIGAVTLLLLAGCKNQPAASSTNSSSSSNATSVAQTSASPEDLGAMGAKIHAHPSDAKKILSDNGMTEASFEKAIRTVSSDPALSRRYAAAYKKAKS